MTVPELGIGERGLIVTSHMTTRPGHFKAGNLLDAEEVRFGLLYWDKLAWPASRQVYLAGGTDEKFLESEGVLIRPTFGSSNIISGNIDMAGAYLSAFEHLEETSPGRWAFAASINALEIDRLLDKDRGTSVELYRAIPVPDRSLPLAEVLEFRLRRGDELLQLRQELDGLFQEIVNSKDEAHALASALDRVQASSMAVLRVGKEAAITVRMSDLSSSINFDLLAGAAALHSLVSGTGIPLTMIGSAIGAKASFDLFSGYRARKRALESHPYRYVHHIHNDLM